MNMSGVLSRKVKLGYGAGEFAGSIFWLTIAFWLMNYLTDEVGLSASLAGMALMIGKIWDAVTDPAAGFLSDKTRTRWGRRKPWFLFSALPFGLMFLIMFINPGIKDQTLLFLWVTISFMLLCTAYTCFVVPYNALLPELTKNFDERSSLSAYKSIYAVVATLLGAGLAMPIIGSFSSRTAGFIGMGSIYGLLIVIAVLIPFFTVKEPRFTGTGQIPNIFKSNLDAFKNRPFSLLLTSWMLTTCGIVMQSATLVYYFKYIYHDETLITLASVVMLVTSMIFIPISVKMSEKFGKRNTYIVGLGIFIVAILLFAFIGHLFGMIGIYLIMFLAGVGLSTHYVLPWALVPDTVEYDYSLTGVRKEGVYYGLWTFAIKIGQAIAVVLMGFILDGFGYLPDVSQTETSLLGIRMLIGPFPAILFALGILFLFFYPIDKNKYEEIQRDIAQMESNLV